MTHFPSVLSSEGTQQESGSRDWSGMVTIGNN